MPRSIAARFHAFRQRRTGSVDLLFAMLARGAGVLLALAANGLIARLLGPEKFGLYMTLLSVALVGGGLAAYGLGPVLIREIAAASSGSWGDVLRSTGAWALRFSAGLSVLVMVLVLAWLALGPGVPTSSWKERILTVSIIPLLAAVILVAGMLSGMSQVARSQSIGTILKNGVLLIGVALLFVFRADRPTDVLLVQVISFGLAVLIALFWIRRSILQPNGFSGIWLLPSIQPEKVRILRRAAGHFFAGSLAALILGRLDVVIVNAIAGPTQAGLFGVGARLGQVAMIAGLVWSAWLQPRIARQLRLGQGAALKRSLRIGIAGSAGMAGILVALGWWFAPKLMLLMGGGFSGAVWPFRWLLLGGFEIGRAHV